MNISKYNPNVLPPDDDSVDDPDDLNDIPPYPHDTNVLPPNKIGNCLYFSSDCYIC
jgi:hypothetical protein